MHEMGIAIQIMSIVMQSLPPAEPLRVKSITLRVGKMTAIVPSSLKFCLEVVGKDTVADGSEIIFNEVPVQVSCSDCGKESVIEEPPFACGSCGSDNVEVIAGREMVVESIEVDDFGPGADTGADAEGDLASKD